MGNNAYKSNISPIIFTLLVLYNAKFVYKTGHLHATYSAGFPMHELRVRNNWVAPRSPQPSRFD